MKHFILLALTLVTLIGTAQAQRGPNRDSRPSIVRIEVGDDRDDRDMLRRIHKLERAVNELQNKVYDLQSAPVKETGVYCMVNNFHAGIVEATAPTRLQAEAAIQIQFERKGKGIFYSARELKCSEI